MIKSVRLLNWRSHSDTTLQFSEGTNLIVGIMGAGKSSVLEAISFAFFGTFPALEHRKLKLEDIIRLNETAAKAVLEFEWDGASYRIERTIERSKRGASSGAEIFRDNSLLEHGPGAVNSLIAGLTGVDYDLFTRAIYSEQNNIDYFLTLDPRRRKQEIDTLLGLDNFEDARANAVTVINTIKGKREVLEQRFSKERLSELQASEQQNAQKAQGLVEKAKAIAEVYGKEAKSLDSQARSFEELRKKKELSERLEKEALQLSAICESLGRETASFDEKAYQEAKRRLAALSEERSKVNASAKPMDEEIQRLSRESGGLESKLKAAAEAKIRLDERKKELSALLGGKKPEELAAQQKEAERSLLSADSERKSIEREMSETDELLRKLHPGTSECPLCGSKIVDIGHIRSEKTANLDRIKGRLAQLAKMASEAKKTNESLLLVIRKASILTEAILSSERELAGVEQVQNRKAEQEAKLASVRSLRLALGKRLDELGPALEKASVEASRSEALGRKKKELEQASKRALDIESQRKTISFDPPAFESLRQQLESSRLAVERLTSDKRSAETELRSCNEVLAIIRKELGQMHALEQDISALSKLEEELSIYRNALLETQTGLRESLVDAISSAMNEVWPIFYPYRNYSALRLEVTDRDYVFEVNDGKDWKGLESMASGGERASAALTLRVALAMVLTPRLSWLILDEPTHNLDKDAVELLSSALQTRVPEVVKQTFVITHEEAIMGSEFASSYRLTRDKEINGETKAERI